MEKNSDNNRITENNNNTSSEINDSKETFKDCYSVEIRSSLIKKKLDINNIDSSGYSKKNSYDIRSNINNNSNKKNKNSLLAVSTISKSTKFDESTRDFGSGMVLSLRELDLQRKRNTIEKKCLFYSFRERKDKKCNNNKSVLI